MNLNEKIKVYKKEEGVCYACKKERKTTVIAVKGTMLEPHGTIELCSQCLAWLKGKLRGF